MRRSYTGIVPERAVFRVTVVEGRYGRPLNPRTDLVNHSPTGYAWGYSGSGPHQLGLALLADALGDDDRAQRLHHRFTTEEISPLDADHGWTMSSTMIQAWANRAEQEPSDT